MSGSENMRIWQLEQEIITLARRVAELEHILLNTAPPTLASRYPLPTCGDPDES